MSDYFSTFMKHAEAGAILFRDLHAAGNSKGAAAACEIVGASWEACSQVSEAKALSEIFAALDAKNQSAVLPIIEARLLEIAALTKRTMSTWYNDASEATETEYQQLHADMNRFVEAIQGAHSLAILTLSAGG